jgi:replicative DNA helicase
MSCRELVLRMLCSEARVDSHRMRTGFLSKEDLGKISKALGELSQARIFIDDSSSISVVELRSKARRLKAEHGLDLLVLDYLQLMTGRDKDRYENRNQEVSAISRSLKGLAKELDIPVVAISQLSRAPEQRRGDHRPQLSDLRESGSIEQDADLVAFIYREDLFNPTDENLGLAEMIIAKQRNGPPGTFKMAFLDQFTRFENAWEE